jgi:uncharacterized protein (TIGR02145 family)
MKKLQTWIFVLLFSLIGFSLTFAQNNWTCGDDLTDSRDGQTYKTVSINGVCWMAENLNYGNMIQSNSQGYQMQDNGMVEKYCWKNLEDYCDGTNGQVKKGAFYEWKEAMQYYSGQPADPVQGVCPEGWHIPQQSEFEALITFLGGSSVAGDKMKTGGSSGFEGILTGYRCTMTGGFLNSPTSSDYIAYYWSTKEANADNAYFYELNEANSKFANGLYSPFYKSLGLSIRCIKDETSNLEKNDAGKLNVIQTIIDTESKEVKVFYQNKYSREMNFEIYNLNGQQLLSKKINPSVGNNIMVISIKTLSNGTYILKITNGIENHTDKIIF